MKKEEGSERCRKRRAERCRKRRAERCRKRLPQGHGTELLSNLRYSTLRIGGWYDRGLDLKRVIQKGLAIGNFTR